MLCCSTYVCAASSRLAYFVFQSSLRLWSFRYPNTWVSAWVTGGGLEVEDPVVSKSTSLQGSAVRRIALLVCRTQDSLQDSYTALTSLELKAVAFNYWRPSQIALAGRPLGTGQQSKKGGNWRLLPGPLWARASYRGNWRYGRCGSTMQIQSGQLSYDLISFLF